MNIYIFPVSTGFIQVQREQNSRVDTVIERFNAKVCASTGWRNSGGGFLWRYVINFVVQYIH